MNATEEPRTPPMTLSWLVQRGACLKARKVFVTIFGSAAEVTKENIVKMLTHPQTMLNPWMPRYLWAMWLGTELGLSTWIVEGQMEGDRERLLDEGLDAETIEWRVRMIAIERISQLIVEAWRKRWSGT